MRSEPGRPGRLELAALLGSLALALALRLPLMGRGLEGDELWTVLDFVNAPTWWETVSRVGGFNNHHFYSLLARLTEQALGRSEWVLRLPALLFGVGLIPLVWWGLRREFGRWIAGLAALLLASSSIHIGLSVTARGYSALIFFTWCSTLLFIPMLRQASGWRNPVLFALLSALGIWSHLYGVMVLGVQGLLLALLSLRQMRRYDLASAWARFRWPLLGVAGAGLLSALLYAPAAAELFVNLHGPRSGFEPRLPVRLLTYLVGGPLNPAAILLAALMVAGLGLALRGRPLETWYTVLLFAVPLLMVWVGRPEFVRTRFFVFLLPFTALGLAAAAERVWRLGQGTPARSSWSAGAARVLTMALLAAAAWQWSARVWSNVPSGGWRAAARALEAPPPRPDARVATCAIGYGTRFYAWYTNAPVLDPRSLEEFMALRKNHDVVRCAWRRAGIDPPGHAAIRGFLETRCGPPEQLREIRVFTCDARKP